MTAPNTVLSSDIDFAMVAEKVSSFDSLSSDAKFYVIDKTSKDIIMSNITDSVGPWSCI